MTKRDRHRLYMTGAIVGLVAAFLSGIVAWWLPDDTPAVFVAGDVVRVLLVVAILEVGWRWQERRRRAEKPQ